jgi:hypothetical protein
MKPSSRVVSRGAVRPWLLLLAACLGACLCARGQTLVVRPQDALMDERVAVRVADLKPRQPVVIRASTQDADGKLWQSFAGFYADARGAVDPAKQAPANGMYTKVDPMGLVRSMHPPGADYDRARFTYKRADALTFKFSQEVDGLEGFTCSNPEYQDYVNEFREEIEDLVESALAVDKPICF